MIAPAKAESRRRVGEIRSDVAYPLESFMEIAGLSWAALRAARSRGLKVCKVGKRSWVRGADWLEHLAAHVVAG